MIRPLARPLAFALLSLAAALPAAAGTKIVIFPFEMADAGAMTDSTGQLSAGAFLLQQQGTPEDGRRLKLATSTLTKFLEADPQLTVVSITPLDKKVADAAPLHKCNGCEADLAKELGADLAVLGKVTKLTPVLLHFDISVRDATSGDALRAVSVEINGDTDELWVRGVRWLYKNRLSDPALVKP